MHAPPPSVRPVRMGFPLPIASGPSALDALGPTSPAATQRL